MWFLEARATPARPALGQFTQERSQPLSCDCHHLGQVDRPCACTPAMVAHYRQWASGPLLDRLDMQVAVTPVRRADVVGGRPGESTALVAGRVATAEPGKWTGSRW